MCATATLNQEHVQWAACLDIEEVIVMTLAEFVYKATIATTHAAPVLNRVCVTPSMTADVRQGML